MTQLSLKTLAMHWWVILKMSRPYRQALPVISCLDLGTSKTLFDIHFIKCTKLINRKAIVWKGFQQAHVLEGHAAAIWATLFVEDNVVLTASADKTIRLWRDGRQVHIYQGHTDAVRGLALLPGIGFVSCSNDA
jgi:WD40 repeat protein